MNRDHVDRFCSRVCAHVRFSPDHAAITAELTAHLEDHAAALEARGFPSDVAVQQAVDAMGDPKEIGKELDKSHSPFLGWFQIWFPAAVWTLLLLSILTAAYSLCCTAPPPLRLPSQAEAEWLQTHRSFPQVAGELDPQAVYQGAELPLLRGARDSAGHPYRPPAGLSAPGLLAQPLASAPQRRGAAPRGG